MKRLSEIQILGYNKNAKYVFFYLNLGYKTKNDKKIIFFVWVLYYEW